jgi:Icc-related predicted phosphoesterase
MSEIKEFNDQIYAVAGNCDLTGVDTYLSNQSINLHGKTLSINGVDITGLGGSLPCPGRTPNEYSDQDLALALNSATKIYSTGSPLLLLAHQPPVYTINDRISNGAHVGSEAVRKFIVKKKPLICFTGHIHEGIGIDSIGPTKIVNPGPSRLGGYTVAQVGKTVEELEIRNWKRG